MLSESQINKHLINFLNKSTSPFHAVLSMQELLNTAGFTQLLESEQWCLIPGEKYYVTRNDSSIIAFHFGEKIDETGIAMVGAHTDSPSLKIKPIPELNRKGYQQLGVEVYGGALLNPWFDRDLSISGQVGYINKAGVCCNELIDFHRAIAIIPSLAIHLDRDANRKRSINAQTDITPILALANQQQPWNFKASLKSELIKNGYDVEQILDFELYCYDTQPANLIGLDEEFITGARLDNLLSCYIGLQALLDTATTRTSLLICTDHEEVGSASTSGAQGTFLDSVLTRITANSESKIRAIAQSMMVSVDNAHGIHPNFPDKHDANHGPLLNSGPVIKINASQRYASNTETSSIFRHLCMQHNIPLQTFVMRSDMACGSTIGPITSTEIGVKTVDIGVPTFAMHSIREIAGAKDPLLLYKALTTFFDKYHA